MFYSPDLPSGCAPAPPVGSSLQYSPNSAQIAAGASTAQPPTSTPPTTNSTNPHHQPAIARESNETDPTPATTGPQTNPPTEPRHAIIGNQNNATPTPTGNTTTGPKPIAIPSFDEIANAPASTYAKMIRQIHDEFVDGNAEEYHEIQIPLPRNLQGLRVATIMNRLEQMNTALKHADWSAVTADVVGHNLVLASVGPKGLEQLLSLKELKLEHGKSTPLATPQRPNNLYYVEMLLPHEIEMHRPLLGALLKTFRNVSHILNPGRKAFGSNRRVRLYFKSITAPREVFTAEDPNIPIREIVLPCGTAAQIVHKWQRMNSFPPPHLAGRWLGRNGRRSYAAATRASNPPINGNTPRNIETTMHPQPPTPQPRPGVVPTGPPARSPTNNTHAPPPAQDEDNNMIDAHPQREIAQPNHHDADNHNNPHHEIGQSNAPSSQPNEVNAHTNGTKNNTGCTTEPQENTINNNQNHDEEMEDNPTIQASTHINPEPTMHATTPPSSRNQTSQQQQEWQTVPINRATKKPIREGAKPIAMPATTNAFAVLTTQPLDAFEDDEFTPIAVSAPGEHNRQAYKSVKTRKCKTNALLQSMRSTQQVRHPHNTLKHLPPNRAQFVLASDDPELNHGRRRLTFQIALMRMARAKPNNPNKKMANADDSIYFDECCNFLSQNGLSPNIQKDARIDSIVLHLHKLDQNRMRKSYHLAKMDLITRAYLPHLYDASPRPEQWHGIDICWNPSPDNLTPCMDDQTLINLANNRALHAVWSHASNTAPEIKRTIEQLRDIHEAQLNFAS